MSEHAPTDASAIEDDINRVIARECGALVAADWQAIETAPKTFDTDLTLPAGGLIRRIRMALTIKVRGASGVEPAEFYAYWAQVNDKLAGWYALDGEPLDWPVTEWRHLTSKKKKSWTEMTRRLSPPSQGGLRDEPTGLCYRSFMGVLLGLAGVLRQAGG